MPYSEVCIRCPAHLVFLYNFILIPKPVVFITEMFEWVTITFFLPKFCVVVFGILRERLICLAFFVSAQRSVRHQDLPDVPAATRKDIRLQDSLRTHSPSFSSTTPRQPTDVFCGKYHFVSSEHSKPSRFLLGSKQQI